jgi:branched-chain amino acid transport system permease protein
MNVRVITKGTPFHRGLQLAGWLALVVAVWYVAYQGPNYLVPRYSLALTYALAILGLNLVTGFNGQVSLGHSAFFGIGAYTTMILINDHGWPLLAALVPAAIIGAMLGYAVGVPALRIRGLYLSLVTLGLPIAFEPLALKFGSLTGGGDGKSLKIHWKAPGWMPGHLNENSWAFVTIAAIAAVMFVLASNMIRSRAGRALVSLRDNEIGAAVSGVYPAGYKTTAFAMSASYASIAGGLYALAAKTITPYSFGTGLSIQFITGLVIGGIATIIGPLIGGLVTIFLPYLTQKQLEGVRANILFGAILIALAFIMPGGILAGVRQIRAKFVRLVPRLPARSGVGSGQPEPSASSQ